ncbi:hypothetical protein BDZ45DRAFT_739608 [Acephala macrosclerotiorum]|nr:hypothetical protein BDZ45DRAFT_739608 [Acephala macrosclerotiorum]
MALAQSSDQFESRILSFIPTCDLSITKTIKTRCFKMFQHPRTFSQSQARGRSASHFPNIQKTLSTLNLTNAMTACTDSPLTITGNILSILTFFLGLIASYLTFYTLTLSATSEIHTFKSDLETTKKQLSSVL